MRENKLTFTLGAVATAALATTSLWGQQSDSSELKDRLILDTRVRYENVDQEWGGDAEALTLRARVGFESEDYEGFKFLVEGEFTTAADDDDFDAYPGATGTPGKALIADGDTSELNRAQITYTNGEFTTVLGRQRIILDNARFIGNVGWRQNEQTYDAATFVYSPDAKSRLIYAYVDRVQRIFGSEAVATAQRKLDTKAHVLNYNYKPDENSQWGAYFYDLGVETAPAASTRTFGAFYQGSVEVEGDWKLTSRMEYARQTENGSSPTGMDFALNYFHAKLDGAKDAFSLGAGWESLGGDGTVGFSTPLATLHAYNGWADAFLSTPANGLDDKYVWGGYKIDKTKNVKVFYHQFEADQGRVSYADEVDFVFAWKLNDETSFTAKYATYNGKGEAPAGLNIDRNKLWVQFDYKY